MCPLAGKGKTGFHEPQNFSPGLYSFLRDCCNLFERFPCPLTCLCRCFLLQGGCKPKTFKRFLLRCLNVAARREKEKIGKGPYGTWMSSFFLVECYLVVFHPPRRVLVTSHSPEISSMDRRNQKEGKTKNISKIHIRKLQRPSTVDVSNFEIVLSIGFIENDWFQEVEKEKNENDKKNVESK